MTDGLPKLDPVQTVLTASASDVYPAFPWMYEHTPSVCLSLTVGRETDTIVQQEGIYPWKALRPVASFVVELSLRSPEHYSGRVTLRVTWWKSV